MTRTVKKRVKKGVNKFGKMVTITLVIAIGMTTLGLAGCGGNAKEANAQNGKIVSGSSEEKIHKNEKSNEDLKIVDSLDKNGNDKKEVGKVDNDNQNNQNSLPPSNSNVSNPDVPAAVHPSDPNNYFADALFIGDSRMQGFMLYSGIDATGYTEPGLDVNTVLTKPFIRVNGTKATIPQALEANQFGKIYIKLGMNELGWVYTDKFINQYGVVIDKLKELQPQATIYIEAILPVTATKDSKGTHINNKRIAEYNALIQKLATDKAVNFIDASSAVSDENGYLYEEAATDGVHLNKKYCQLWYQYLLDHK